MSDEKREPQTTVSEIINSAQAARIAREDLATRVARIIDPGAFSIWMKSTSEGVESVLPDARKRYAQAVALHKAEQILKLAVTISDLRRRLADDEIAGWIDLGVPMSDSASRKIVEGKYGI